MSVTESEVLHIAEQLDKRAAIRVELAVGESWGTSAKDKAEAARDVTVLQHCAKVLRLHAAELR